MTIESVAPPAGAVMPSRAAPAASPGAHATARERPHVPALDGLRGVAILTVMLYHFTLDHRPRPLRLLVHGVDLFFVLSGFLITGILLDAKGSPTYFRGFYARRFLRIFPVYYLFLALAFAVYPGNDWPWFAAYASNLLLTKAGNWQHGTIDVSWSLSIEEQFYVVWPPLVLWLGAKALRNVSIGLVVTAFACRCLMMRWGFTPTAIYVFTLARIDGLALGALLAILARAPGFSAASARRTAWPIAVGSAALLFGVMMPLGWTAIGSPVFETVGYTIVVLGCAALLVLAAFAPPGGAVAAVFTSAPLRTLGKYSYCLYLVHTPVQLLVRDLLFQDLSTVHGLRQLELYAASLGTSLLVALASWHLLEKRVLALKARFPMR